MSGGGRRACFALGTGEWLVLALADADGLPRERTAPVVQRCDGSRLIDCGWQHACLQLDAERIRAELDRLLPRARGEWLDALRSVAVRPDIDAAPIAAARLDADHLLLSYAALASAPVLRVLRCSDGALCAEIDAASLYPDSRPERQFFPGVPLIECVRIQSARERRALLGFRGQRGLLEWHEGALSLRWCIEDDGSPAQLLGALLVHGAEDGPRPRLTLRDATHLQAISDYHADHPGRCLALVAAANRDRFAISHRGGIVEIVDVGARRTLAYRPFPDAGERTELALAFSPDSEFLQASGAGATRIVDIESAQVASLPEALNWEIGVDECLCVDAGAPRRIGFDMLSWQGLLRLDAAAEVSLTPPTALQRDGLRLHVAAAHTAGRARNSWLYGQCRLPAGHYWPRFEGRPMALLAQLDCADLAAVRRLPGMPERGLLWIHLALDADLQPLDDAQLRPRVLVQYLDESTEHAREAAAPVLAPAQPLRIVDAPGQWPAPDSLQVAAQGWTAAQLEAYRRTLHAAPVRGPRHQLGGYPTRLHDGALEIEVAAEIGPDEPSADWQLLLQLDSDRVCQWAGGGLLYLYIRGADLARRDFSHVVALVESD
ncbi:MAG: YwqG family protein [Lysobacterales bacterium]